MKTEAERQFWAEMERHKKALIQIYGRWPERRFEFAQEELGGAVATCDTFGVSAEETIANMRKAGAHIDYVLVPPERTQS